MMLGCQKLVLGRILTRLERSLAGLEERKESRRDQGAPEEAEPEWAAEARTMLARIPEAPGAQAAAVEG